MKKIPVKTWSTPPAVEEKRPVPCTLCGEQRFKPSLACGSFSYVRCISCGLVQINPQPLPKEIKRRYGASPQTAASLSSEALSPGGQKNGFGKDYLAYEIANGPAFLNLQLLALEDAGFREPERELLSGGKKPRVLDIGCATGSLLARLRERGWETTGVEISLPQAEYAKQKLNLDVRSLPLEDNYFPAALFDTVLASHLIEHVNDPSALVREVRRILIPGGRFFVTTPNIAGFQAKFFKSAWRSAIFDHLYLFSVKTLSRLLLQNGFIIEKTATWGGLAAGTAPAPVKHFFDKAAKRFGFGDVMIIRARKKTITPS